MKSLIDQLGTPCGKAFFERAELLAGYFQAKEKDPELEGLTRAVYLYFDFFLRPKWRKEFSYTGAVTELTAILETFFPVNATDGDEEIESLRTLVEDLSAMLSYAMFNYYETEPRYYNSWRETHSEIAEKSCLFEIDVVILIDRLLPRWEERNSRFAWEMAKKILNLMAEILTIYEIPHELEEQDCDKHLNSQGLLHLYLWYLSGDQASVLKQVPERGEDRLINGLRLWAASDPFVHFLVKESWNLLSLPDYTADPDLNRSFLKKEGGALEEQLNAGIVPGSYAELALISKEKLGNLDHFLPLGANENKSIGSKDRVLQFKPVPIALIGPSKVGKTTILASLVHQLLNGEMDTSFELSPLADLQQLFHEFKSAWVAGKNSATATFSGRHFVAVSTSPKAPKRSITFKITDLPGEYTEPGKFNQEEDEQGHIKDILREACGLIFMVDDVSYTKQATALWYDQILQWYTQVNPGRSHPPVMLVVNKIDTILGKEAFKELASCSLIGNDLQPRFVHAGIPSSKRTSDEDSEESAFLRLWNFVSSRDENNRNIRSQNFCRELFANYQRFIKRFLATTYRYQIFLTSSLAPKKIPEKDTPFGVQEAFSWMAQELGNLHSKDGAQLLAERRQKFSQYIAGLKKSHAEFQADCKKRLIIEQKLRSFEEKMAELEKRTGRALFLKCHERRLKLVEDDIKREREELANLAAQIQEKIEEIKVAYPLEPPIGDPLTQIEEVLTDLKVREKELETFQTEMSRLSFSKR